MANYYRWNNQLRTVFSIDPVDPFKIKETILQFVDNHFLINYELPKHETRVIYASTFSSMSSDFFHGSNNT